MFFFLLSSCEKEGATITKTINVELLANSSFSYAIPLAGDADDVMQITQQGNHFFKSEVIATGSSGYKFTYAPTFNYEGSDEVKISNEESNSGSHGQHDKCSGNQHGNETIYNFKIMVKGSSK